MDKVKKVLFVCIRNTARSVIAEAIFNSIAIEWKAESAGIERAEKIDENVARFLLERGFKPKEKPRSIEDVDFDDYELIVTVCDESSCIVLPKEKKTISWQIEDVAGEDFEKIEKVFKEIWERVAKLVGDLEGRK